MPDSHLNGYIRTKLALTEERPTIKPYDENTWAALADYRLPVDIALNLLDAIQARWVALFSGLTPAQLARTFIHPELGLELLNRAATEVEDVGLIESNPRLVVFAMTMYVVPRKDRVHTKQDKEDGASG